MPELSSIQQEAASKMQRSVESLHKELAKIRTDRAHPNLLEGIMVDYYGQSTQLSRIANIMVEDHRTLSITAFDKNSVISIEKAITVANLGLNPVALGNVIRVPIPQLTEERRKLLVKQTKSGVEVAKVAIRNIRREANMQIKSLLANKQISLNEKESFENKIQKLTDQYIDQVDKIGASKERDVMKI